MSGLTPTLPPASYTFSFAQNDEPKGQGSLINGTYFKPDVLNVNVPRKEPGGVRVTRQGKRLYPGGVIERHDPKGRPYYWIGGQSADWEADPKSDFAALADGCISVTPLHLDLTNDKVMDQVKRWNLAL